MFTPVRNSPQLGSPDILDPSNSVITISCPVSIAFATDVYMKVSFPFIFSCWFLIYDYISRPQGREAESVGNGEIMII